MTGEIRIRGVADVKTLTAMLRAVKDCIMIVPPTSVRVLVATKPRGLPSKIVALLRQVAGAPGATVEAPALSAPKEIRTLTVQALPHHLPSNQQRRMTIS